MGRRLLIVDDEETIRWALRELFMQDGWETHCAEDGDAAARLIAENRYDYLILDLKMPGREASDLICDAMKRNPNVGVTILTGFATLETAVEAIRLRAWDYLTKPCRIADLKRRVDEFFEAGDAEGGTAGDRAPLEQEDIADFLNGAGTEVYSRKEIGMSDGVEDVLRSVTKFLCDLGFGEERALRLTQPLVEAMARVSGDGGQCRAGLLKGHALVSFSAPGAVTAAWREMVEKLNAEMGTHARLIQGGERACLVLSEAI